MNRWIAGVLALVASCGGDGSPEAPSDMSPDGVCTYYADRYCAADHKCESSFGTFWNDLAICKERSRISCLSRLTSPGVNETASRVVSCANALTMLSCERYAEVDRWPEACTPPPGQLADGAPCIVAAQCQGSACDITARAACGVCKTVSRIGGVCTDENDCLNYMPCVNGVCAPHPILGEPCDGAARYCVGGSVCRDLDANGVGICARPSPAGTRCDPGQPDICDYAQGYYCDQFAKTCDKGEALGKIGERCVAQTCPFVAFCDLDDICHPKPREGRPCDPNNSCMTPARCIDGICKIRDPAVCN